jgi:hypothetical protein
MNSFSAYLFISFLSEIGMPLKSFVNETRKTNRLMEQIKERQATSDNEIIDISDGQKVPQEKLDAFRSQQASGLPSTVKQGSSSIQAKTDFEKEYMSRQRSEQRAETIIQGNTKQQIGDKHCNIIANVVKQSGQTFGEKTTWETCKHKKEANNQTYCTEYHSFCGKDRCKRATR